jgi:GTPase Era involved in 16S rRNA processing
MELLKMYDCKVDLRLNVIVKKDWRNNQQYLNKFYK